MNPKITLVEFLKISHNVTNNYIKAWGEWPITDQWKKIKEEEKEFEIASNKLNQLEEFWDNFFAKLTLLHIEKVDDYAIMESAISTWNKINARSLKAIEAQA